MSNHQLTTCLALDCEMVGVGKTWRQDVPARVAIVNENLECVYDKYVKPTKEVTDYRKNITGITPCMLQNGTDFDTVQTEVKNMLQGRILVGHALEHDLHALQITHPEEDIRDTAFYYETRHETRTPALKWLAPRCLGVSYWCHSPVENAKITMRLYKYFKNEAVKANFWKS